LAGKLPGYKGDQYNRAVFGGIGAVGLLGRRLLVQYWVKVVFVDSQELLIKDVVSHRLSEDQEFIYVESPREMILVPIKQIKYLSCDATVFSGKKTS
jgi:hypothetical protein